MIENTIIAGAIVATVWWAIYRFVKPEFNARLDKQSEEEPWKDLE